MANRQKRQNSDAVAIGSRIRQARLRKGLKQRALASLVGTDHVTPWRWEKGDMIPTPARLAKVASALGVTVDWLVKGDTEPESKAWSWPDESRTSWMGAWVDSEARSPRMSVVIMQGEGNGRLLKLLLRALEEKGSDAVEMALKVELAL